MARVNGWTTGEAQKAYQEAFVDWGIRNQFRWALDVSFLEKQYGIEVPLDPSTSRYRVSTAHSIQLSSTTDWSHYFEPPMYAVMSERSADTELEQKSRLIPPPTRQRKKDLRVVGYWLIGLIAMGVALTLVLIWMRALVRNHAPFP